MPNPRREALQEDLKGGFRYGTNRQVEISLSKELDDITRKSLTEIKAKRNYDNIQPLSLEEHTVQKLQPAFEPQKIKAKRKTEPVFHDDNKEIKKTPQFKLVPNVPSYNPLDKISHVPTVGTTKKHPFFKEKIVTTRAMKEPHVTSVGVTPAGRYSDNIPGLRVVMQGKNAMECTDTMLDEIAMANSARPGTPVSPTDQEEQKANEEELEDKVEVALPKKRPAIVASEGTTSQVSFAERKKAVPHPSSLKKPKHKRVSTPPQSAMSISSSLQSEKLHLPGEEGYSQYDEVISGLNSDLENVKTAMKAQEEQAEADRAQGSKSSKDLLEEAKRISRPGSEALYKKKKDSPRKKEGKKDSKKSAREKGKGKGKDKEEDGEPGKPRTERTVDEIIASLKEASSGKGKETDADRRIRELLSGVMSHASASLFESEVQITEEEETEEERQPEYDREGIMQTSTPFMFGGSTVSYTSAEDATETSSPDPDALTDLYEEITADDGSLREIPFPEPVPEETEILLEGEDGMTRLPQQPDRSTDDRATGQADMSGDIPRLDIASLTGEDTFDRMIDPNTDRIDVSKLYEDLDAPVNATYEEIVNIKGKQVDMAQRGPRQPVIPLTTIHSSSTSFLSSWKPMSPRKYPPVPEEEKPPLKNIHHFCTLTEDFQLPEEFRNIGRKYHTPNKFDMHLNQPFRFGSSGPSLVDTSEDDTRSQLSRMTQSREAEEQRLVSAARRVLIEAEEDTGTDREESFERWRQRAEEVFNEQSDITVEGSHIDLRADESRLYWTPAPPKLDVAPSTVKEMLFPEYQASYIAPEIREAASTQQDDYDDEEEEEEVEEMIDPAHERTEEVSRILYKKSASHEDLTKHFWFEQQREADIKAGKIDPFEKLRPLVPVNDDEERPETPPASQQSAMLTGSIALDYVPIFPLLRRSKSLPSITDEDDDTLLVPQDYNTAMEEIKRQKRNIKQMKLNKRLEEIDRLDEREKADVELNRLESNEVLALSSPTRKRAEELTPAEIALAAGRAYVILPKKSKKKKKKGPVNFDRIDEIEKFLRAPPNILERSESMVHIAKPVERALRVPLEVRQGRKNSLPDELDFEPYVIKRGIRDGDDEREFVREIWNKWFDEVFPSTPSDSEEEDDIAAEETEQRESKSQEKRKDSLTSSLDEVISVIDPLEENEESLELLQIMYEEVEKLEEEIAKCNKPKAFDICRRGALYRKIGMVKKAEEDLNRAIKMEPTLIDAYWHRHLLYILQDKKKAALDDLQYILKHSKNHAGAYRSMAEIYRKQGDVTMAIINYTQAVKLNPQDHEAYYQRALMYEKKGEMRLALEDLSKAKKICPTRTDAILKHGLYYFENKVWSHAIQDFTDLLKVDPLNASARTYRGRAYAMMEQWSQSVQDLSAAIHLDPLSWQAFYHRACILRKAHPRRALQDYSVSLMINDTEENVMSYLHRGILYEAMGKYEDAIPDFESVLKLNKDIACAHVNLGLIYMNHFDNYHRAIKKFSAGIKADPTYVRAYVCRGEAYHKIHELKAAMRDFTRAIRLRPDVHHYYMFRGQLVLEMGNLDLAAFCVRLFMHKQEEDYGQAAEMGTDSALGQMPTQQAVVQSFLKNYGKAIEALQTATRAKPTAAMFMLLGKTQMKAKLYRDAIGSFELALNAYKPWKPREPWPTEAAVAHFLIGMCHMELKRFIESLEAFSNAIKLDPNYAEALYQRGVARTKLNNAKGIQDFNRALAIDPKIFQAYLSRACYYGYKKNYTKAILNCNEAIKLQPKSVRAHLYRGALKYHIKAFDLAIADLTTAASIDSTCALAFFNRAVCYQEKKDYQKALTDYGIVLLLGDDLRLEVLINRGLLYFERSDYINALYDFKLAAKLKPKDHRILHTLGLCYHKMEKLKDALEVFTSCIESNASFLDGIIARGNVYMDLGDQGRGCARKDYERALILDPLCLPARVNLAYTLQVTGKFMQAWTQFTTAITIKPTFKPALEGRAIVNLQMSNTFGAYQDINASLNLGPTAELYTNRGVINQFMQDRVNAMRDFQAAIKLDPKYGLAYFNAGNVYFHNRHFRQALEYFNLAIRFNAKDECAFLNRAITRVMLRDSNGALEDFKEALKLSPYTAHIYFNRGNLYASLGKYEDAEKDYSKSLKLKPDDALVLKRRADVRGKLGMKAKAIEDYKQAVEIQGRLEWQKKQEQKKAQS